MSLTFYFAPMSTASVTSLIIEELEIEVERVKIDIQAGGTKKPAFLKVNPNGKVPVIDHDGTRIFESAAITMYLGEQFGVEKGLYPAAGPARGVAMRWIVWANVTFGEAIHRWMRHTSERCPDDQKNARAGEVARQDIDNHFKILDGTLDNKKYLGGDTYTLADAHVKSFIDWAGYLQLDISAFKNLAAWSNRCAERPAYQRYMSAEAA